MTLDFERTLPNGIRFGAKVTPAATAVRMEMWLTNGTFADPHVDVIRPSALVNTIMKARKDPWQYIS